MIPLVRSAAFRLLFAACVLSSLFVSGQAAAQANQPVIDANVLRILLRTTVVALNNANRTGNYTVFRELGSPGFQETNNAARLASIFGPLRSQNLDFGPIVLFDPVFARQPTYDQQGLLQMVGYFPTKPLEVVFNMSFRYLSGRWALEAISIDTRRAANAAAPTANAVAPAAKAERLTGTVPLPIPKPNRDE